MTPADANAILDIIKRAAADTSERRYADLESHLSAGDRVIGQVAQLKLLNEGSPSAALATALGEAAKTANPL